MFKKKEVVKDVLDICGFIAMPGDVLPEALQVDVRSFLTMYRGNRILAWKCWRGIMWLCLVATNGELEKLEIVS